MSAVPQCESCYIEANGEFDLTPMQGLFGGARQDLRSIDMPVMTPGKVEVCDWCGAYTIVGIYAEQLVDPRVRP